MEKSELLKIQDACRSGGNTFFETPTLHGGKEKLWDIRCSPKTPTPSCRKKIWVI
jgi:hypothetical protein